MYLKVINKLGYTSNLAARSMRSRRNNLLGLAVPDIGFPYSIEVMKGINAGKEFKKVLETIEYEKA